MIKSFKYKGRKVTVRVNSYQSPKNLYVGLVTLNSEPFTDVTANLDVDMPPYCCTVKDYSENEGMIKFLLANGFGSLTGESIPSGYVSLPVFQFDKKFLRELDPSGCDIYERRAKSRKDGGNNSYGFNSTVGKPL